MHNKNLKRLFPIFSTPTPIPSTTNLVQFEVIKIYAALDIIFKQA